MSADIRYPREGDVYEAIYDVSIGYMTHYFDLPYTGGGVATLPKGERVRVSYARGDKAIGVYCDPLSYDQLHEQIVDAAERRNELYRGYCLAIETAVLIKSFKLILSAERVTKIGTLVNHGGLWIGRFRNERIGADVELLVKGDASAPDDREIEQLAGFLANAEAQFRALRRKLSFGWSYYPIRITLNQEHRLGVQFQSILPFMRRKMVMDNGSVF
jgi:hypothetical protein